MSTTSYFNTFLSNIRLTKSQLEDLITGHTTLRDRLANDADLSKIIVSTFLQGSYKRATAIKPKNGKRADVDIIVVTNLDQNKTTPQQAIDLFIPFVEKHYKGKYRIQGRSIGIELSYVDLDIVVTSAPSEAEQALLRSESVLTTLALEDMGSNWKLVRNWTEPAKQQYWTSLMLESFRSEAEWKSASLYIPDQEAGCWVETNPLEQIRWTRDKNKNTNSHYINVVKALKWWRVVNLTDLKHPKGYPLEHMIGDCCPDYITSVAEGVVKSLEAIVSKYAWYREHEITPVLPDRGVTSHDVWKRISKEDFVAFYDYVKGAAITARKAFDAELLSDQLKEWRNLFGSEFPVMSEEEARSERLDHKAKLLESGAATIGSSINIIRSTAGVSVPRERNHYDPTNL
ncbi:nucleotidyltransferase [Pontibacter sp. 172403-2]|uniref:SMODS domain-containing nucleotidyltransferase n=1 Tax=Pontibacter rufus TaxID=2791028 RepID=UPI0018AF8456|nr:nucleotidyltransferase [Pontibacter sp. 172403-2]MBF9255630.1 nucleotidyltransferase [Pontibacter sp. 172403-2]